MLSSEKVSVSTLVMVKNSPFTWVMSDTPVMNTLSPVTNPWPIAVTTAGFARVMAEIGKAAVLPRPIASPDASIT